MGAQGAVFPAHVIEHERDVHRVEPFCTGHDHGSERVFAYHVLRGRRSIGGKREGLWRVHGVLLGLGGYRWRAALIG